MLSIQSVSLLDPLQLALVTRLRELGQAINQNNLRLASGTSINSAADNPSGLVASQLLQSDLTALQVVSGGLTHATSVLSTATNSAGQILTQLQQAQSLATAAAAGGLSTSTLASNQSQLDQILRSIDTLANSSFEGTSLLNGQSGYSLAGVDATKIKNAQVISRTGSSSASFAISVTSAATQATNSYAGGTLVGPATVTIAGPQGTTTITLATNSATSDIATAFNAVAYLTGVNAVATDSTHVNFNTVDYGSAAKFSITANSGSFATTSSGTVSGTDAVATINGQSVTGSGSTFTATSGGTTVQASVDPTVTGAITSFTVSGSGDTFVLGTRVGNTAQIGLPNLTLGNLNGLAGTLASVLGGGTNSLTSNPTNALRIINNAIATVTASQTNLGSFQKYSLGSAANVVNSTITNETAAWKAIAGVDANAETAALANNQLLQQTTQQALQLYNLQRQNVLGLLTSLASKA